MYAVTFIDLPQNGREWELIHSRIYYLAATSLGASACVPVHITAGNGHLEVARVTKGCDLLLDRTENFDQSTIIEQKQHACDPVLNTT